MQTRSGICNPCSSTKRTAMDSTCALIWLQSQQQPKQTSVWNKHFIVLITSSAAYGKVNWSQKSIVTKESFQRGGSGVMPNKRRAKAMRERNKVRPKQNLKWSLCSSLLVPPAIVFLLYGDHRHREWGKLQNNLVLKWVIRHDSDEHIDQLEHANVEYYHFIRRLGWLVV